LLRSEPGSDRVQSRLADAVISTVNLSEVLAKAAEASTEGRKYSGSGMAGVIAVFGEMPVLPLLPLFPARLWPLFPCRDPDLHFLRPLLTCLARPQASLLLPAGSLKNPALQWAEWRVSSSCIRRVKPPVSLACSTSWH